MDDATIARQKNRDVIACIMPDHTREPVTSWTHTAIAMSSEKIFRSVMDAMCAYMQKKGFKHDTKEYSDADAVHYIRNLMAYIQKDLGYSCSINQIPDELFHAADARVNEMLEKAKKRLKIGENQ